MPQRFEDVFAKYAGGRDYMTWGDVMKTWNGQRCAGDPIGWAGEAFECKSLLLLLPPISSPCGFCKEKKQLTCGVLLL